MITDEQWAELEPLAIEKMRYTIVSFRLWKEKSHAKFDMLRNLADAQIAYNEKLREIIGREQPAQDRFPELPVGSSYLLNPDEKPE